MATELPVAIQTGIESVVFPRTSRPRTLSTIHDQKVLDEKQRQAAYDAALLELVESDSLPKSYIANVNSPLSQTPVRSPHGYTLLPFAHGQDIRGYRK